MPAFVRGYIVCNGCGKSENASASIGRAWDKTSFWWTLPEGWVLYESRNHGSTSVYCSYKCNKYSASMGSPTQTGKAPASGEFDARTLDKLHELVEIGANTRGGADAVLSAIEAVLIAWRKRGAVTS